MTLKNWWKKLHYWFKAGFVGLLIPAAIVLLSVGGSIDLDFVKDFDSLRTVGYGIFVLVAMMIFALASGIIYFFIAATAAYYSKFRKIDNYWTKITFYFYCISCAIMLLFALSGNFLIAVIFLPIFPLLYGWSFILNLANFAEDIFYEPLSALFPNEIITWLVYAIASVIHLTLFTMWIYLESTKKKTKWKHLASIKTIILILIFAMLAVGMVGCAQQFGKGL